MSFIKISPGRACKWWPMCCWCWWLVLIRNAGKHVVQVKSANRNSLRNADFTYVVYKKNWLLVAPRLLPLKLSLNYPDRPRREPREDVAFLFRQNGTELSNNDDDDGIMMMMKQWWRLLSMTSTRKWREREHHLLRILPAKALPFPYAHNRTTFAGSSKQLPETAWIFVKVLVVALVQYPEQKTYCRGPGPTAGINSISGYCGVVVHFRRCL